MPTTPGGRFSPGDSDDWDLTTDLAAMQVSNEAASATEISAALAAAPQNYRVGTDAQRLALSGANLYSGIMFRTTDTNLTWISTSSAAAGWRIAPGQVLARGTFNVAPTTVGSIIGSVISTVPLPIGQNVRVSSKPVGATLSGTGGVVYDLNARNNASDVTSTTFTVSQQTRAFVGVSGNVVSIPGTSYQLTTTVAAKVSAAMYLGNGLVYAADGQELWIESA